MFGQAVVHARQLGDKPRGGQVINCSIAVDLPSTGMISVEVAVAVSVHVAPFTRSYR
jgi:hypothetical protein